MRANALSDLEKAAILEKQLANNRRRRGVSIIDVETSRPGFSDSIGEERRSRVRRPSARSDMRFPVGKYAGQLLHEVPLSYLDWFERKVPVRGAVTAELMAEIHRLAVES